ncbi:MAG: fimbrillin family protein [Bacteroidaceae bacterium]|nr:fimbrillin family protein [Bacteroidaceae bacterium]
MKKSYLMIAAATAMLAACSSNDTIKEVIIESEGPQISFSTYAQKATRAENSDSTYKLNLSDHHLTFKVYGYKNTADEAVFAGDSVGYSSSKWSYVRNRYWDKAATTYEFYAFAPESAPFTFNGVTNVATQKNGYFTITSSYNKVGDNVSPMNSQKPLISWKDLNTAKTDTKTPDIDLMIADTCRLSGAELKAAQVPETGKVTLNFIHILSRLNITLKTIADLNPEDPTLDSLCVDSIVISNFAHAGTFSEIQNNVGAAALQAGTTQRWTATDKASYKYILDYTATLNPIYAIEALMIPQEIVKDTINLDGTFPTGADEDAPYIKIDYSIYSYNTKDGSKLTNKEHYTAYYNLAYVFGEKTDGNKVAFNEGWMNTLNITISPTTIKFDAKVAPWAEKLNEDLTID